MRKYHVLRLSPLGGPQTVIWSGDDIIQATEAYERALADPANEGSFIVFTNKIKSDLVVSIRAKPGRTK